MIEHLKIFPDNVVALRCTGRVTKAEYEMVILPAILNSLSSHEKVRLYYETGADFVLEVGAMWEDFKIGVEYLTRWERIAVVTDIDWIRKAIRFFSLLMPAQTEVFSLAETAKAREWIARD